MEACDREAAVMDTPAGLDRCGRNQADVQLRIGNYVIRPDANHWIVATIKTRATGAQKGEEYESDVRVPCPLRSGPQNGPRQVCEEPNRAGCESGAGRGDGSVHLCDDRRHGRVLGLASGPLPHSCFLRARYGVGKVGKVTSEAVRQPYEACITPVG